MSSNDRPFRQNRNAALRVNDLLDITAIARLTEFGMPASLTPKLGRAISDDAQFRLEDPRGMSLCWHLFLVLMTHAYDREHINEWSRTVWFEAPIRGRSVRVKAMAHLASGCERVMTLMTPKEGCVCVR
jgi:hypothetical protein